MPKANSKKSSPETINRRVNDCYTLLCQGLSTFEILLEGSERWGVCHRQVETYLSRARKQLQKDCEITRQEFLAEAMGRLRTQEKAAARRGQHQVAVNSIRLQSELIGLTG